MALEWPQVGQDILLGIQRHFASPLQFDAAFDDDLGAAELIRSIFPDMVPEDIMNHVAVVMVWKENSSRFCKRARLEVVSHAMYVPLHAAGDTVQNVFKQLTQTNVLTLIESHAKRRQRVHRLEAETRAKRSDVERKKYSLLLAQVIIDAELPVVALIQTWTIQNRAGSICLELGGAIHSRIDSKPGGHLQFGWNFIMDVNFQCS